tara:strand:+ start:336 stop:506 length:171 start_codon:yes stop_codon:yes gene_type:complete
MNEYPKNKLYVNAYTNKRGVKKFGINLDEKLAKKLSDSDQSVIDAIILELKKEIED